MFSWIHFGSAVGIIMSMVMLTVVITFFTLPLCWIYWVYRPEQLLKKQPLTQLLFGVFALPGSWAYLFWTGPVGPILFLIFEIWVYRRACVKTMVKYQKPNGEWEMISYDERRKRERAAIRTNLQNSVLLPPLFRITDPVVKTVSWAQMECGRVARIRFKQSSQRVLTKETPFYNLFVTLFLILLIGAMGFVTFSVWEEAQGDPLIALPVGITFLLIAILFHNIRLLMIPCNIDLERNRFIAGGNQKVSLSLDEIYAIQVVTYKRKEHRSDSSGGRYINNTYFQQNFILKDGERVNICDSDYRSDYEHNVALLSQMLEVPVWDMAEKIRVPKDSEEGRRYLETVETVPDDPEKELLMLRNS